jgi:hypothetical protein
MTVYIVQRQVTYEQTVTAATAEAAITLAISKPEDWEDVFVPSASDYQAYLVEEDVK